MSVAAEARVPLEVRRLICSQIRRGTPPIDDRVLEDQNTTLLSLTLVCKRWRIPAREMLYETLDSRSIKSFSHLLSVLALNNVPPTKTLVWDNGFAASPSASTRNMLLRNPFSPKEYCIWVVPTLSSDPYAALVFQSLALTYIVALLPRLENVHLTPRINTRDAIDHASGVWAPLRRQTTTAILERTGGPYFTRLRTFHAQGMLFDLHELGSIQSKCIHLCKGSLTVMKATLPHPASCSSSTESLVLEKMRIEHWLIRPLPCFSPGLRKLALVDCRMDCLPADFFAFLWELLDLEELHLDVTYRATDSKAALSLSGLKIKRMFIRLPTLLGPCPGMYPFPTSNVSSDPGQASDTEVEQYMRTVPRFVDVLPSAIEELSVATGDAIPLVEAYALGQMHESMSMLPRLVQIEVQRTSRGTRDHGRSWKAHKTGMEKWMEESIE